MAADSSSCSPRPASQIEQAGERARRPQPMQGMPVTALKAQNVTGKRSSAGAPPPRPPPARRQEDRAQRRRARARDQPHARLRGKRAGAEDGGDRSRATAADEDERHQHRAARPRLMPWASDASDHEQDDRVNWPDEPAAARNDVEDGRGLAVGGHAMPSSHGRRRRASSAVQDPRADEEANHDEHGAEDQVHDQPPALHVRGETFHVAVAPMRNRPTSDRSEHRLYGGGEQSDVADDDRVPGGLPIPRHGHRLEEAAGCRGPASSSRSGHSGIR